MRTFTNNDNNTYTVYHIIVPKTFLYIVDYTEYTEHIPCISRFCIYCMSLCLWGRKHLFVCDHLPWGRSTSTSHSAWSLQRPERYIKNA